MLELTAATSGVLQDDYANHVEKGRRDFRLTFSWPPSRFA